MGQIAELPSGAASLLDDGSVLMEYDGNLSKEDQAKEYKRAQRELIQMYIDSELKRAGGSGIEGVESYLYKIAPGFKGIETDVDLEGTPYYRALWD